MVGGWRRAFCTTNSKNGEPKIAIDKQRKQSNDDDDNHLPSPKFTSRFSFFSNPSTPRLQSQPVVSTTNLRCKTTPVIKPTASAPESPRLHCKTTKNSPRFFFRSNPSSPKLKSPSTFSLLKTSLRFSKNRCGICLQSVKTGQGTAIFTAECSHGFHFPCIAAHVRKQGGLVCPVCSAHWKELPLLASRPIRKPEPPPQEESKSPKKESVSKNLKVYNDDEPLMSPTASGGFVSIPESDENEEDDEEFQGFFLSNINNNHNNTPMLPVKIRQGDPTITQSVNVTLSREAAVISVSRSSETYAVVLKVKAPPSPVKKSSLPISSNRAPIDLVTVVDVSERMSGQKEMSMKRAMKLVISSLSSNDRLSIVAFSTTSKRLFPLRRMTANGRRSARRIIDALSCIGQDACAADAVKKASKVLDDRRERNSSASILLLSNGQENHSPNNSSNPYRPRNIPVHTFHFTNVASAFDHAPSDEAFTKCFAKVLSVVVQDLRLELDFVTGSAHAQILAIYTCNTDQPALIDGPALVRFNDLYADEERELLLELKVPSSGSRSHHHVLSVQSSYKDPSSQKLVYSKDQALLVPRPQSVRSSSPNIERLRFLFVTTRALAESRRLIDRNDLSGAHRMLSSGRDMLVQSRSGLAEEYMRGLEAELATLNSHRQHQLQIQRPRTVEAVVRKDCGVYFDEKGEPLTPTSAWRAAERLAKVAIMRKSLNRVSDLHGFENARF